jgi:hypothetical protein
LVRNWKPTKTRSRGIYRDTTVVLGFLHFRFYASFIRHSLRDKSIEIYDNKPSLILKGVEDIQNQPKRSVTESCACRVSCQPECLQIYSCFWLFMILKRVTWVSICSEIQHLKCKIPRMENKA